jgi:hypothetical protein
MYDLYQYSVAYRIRELLPVAHAVTAPIAVILASDRALHPEK